MTRSARDQLIVDNLPLVGYLVSEIWGRATHLSRDDLASAASLGLVMAADSFDAERGVPFGAYARRRITGAIADEMRSADWATRTMRTRIKETLAVQETLTRALGRTPEVGELSQALGVDNATARAALDDAGTVTTALDEHVTDTVAAQIASPEDSMIDGERTAFVRAAVDALPEKMRYLVEQIFFQDRSVTDLATEMGITHSAVSQMRSEAMRLLKDGIATHYGDEGDAPVVPSSRIAPARRSAYLAALADFGTSRLRAASLASPVMGMQAAG
jgi:RNA polymerase sigma factor for flagellar operon FliA